MSVFSPGIGHQENIISKSYTTIIQLNIFNESRPVVKFWFSSKTWSPKCLLNARISFKPLASRCGCAGRFESYLVANPENRFSRDEAYFTVGEDKYGEHNHGSMYYDLWSNNPKESLEFPEYTYEQHFGKLLPSYVPRAAMRDYLEGNSFTLC